MNEFKVGLLAILSIVAIIYMSLKVTSNQSGFGDYVTYKTIIDDASGIFPKTPIKIAGINKGKIKVIELQGNKALITFEILEEVLVTQGSILKVKTVGVLGDKYLEIILGENTKSKERLAPNSLLVSEKMAGFENLATDASDVLKEVKDVVKSVKDALNPIEGGPPLQRFVQDVDEIMTNIKDVSVSLKRLVSGNEQKMESIIINLEKFTHDLKYHMDGQQSDSVMSDLKEILTSTKKMTADLSIIVADLKKGKGSIGQMLVEDEIADEVKETIAGVKKIVNRVDSIRTELALFTGVDSRYGGATDADLTIYPSPERFYLLGVTTSEVGVSKEKETITSENGLESRRRTKEIERNTYRFNIQLGRKIHNWSFRAGLIDSNGGLGVDYFIEKWKTKITFETFDFGRDSGPYVRLFIEKHFWNVFYGKVGGHDLNLEDRRSGSISIGVRFLDEDLKGLLGFFL